MLANANRPSHIETLISGVDRYNPSSEQPRLRQGGAGPRITLANHTGPADVHLLEDYLQQQLANDQYDLLANLALLKL